MAARATTLVLSGGIALGAYEAGAYEALAEGGDLPTWLLGASAGALNAAIIAGNPPERRVEGLRRFWDAVSDEPMPWTSFWLGPPPERGAWRQAYNQMAVLRALFLGRPGLFESRMLATGLESAPALYDLGPLRRLLPQCLDFDRLNHPGAPRLTVVATDVVSGERVVFDTAHGVRIGPDHLLASSALLPVFGPVEVEGRLLGDGGLSSNAPLDLVLDEPAAGAVLCVLVELFAERGSRPRTLAASASRAGDLAFGNQTRRMIEAAAREYRLRDLLGRLADRLPPDLRDAAGVAPVLAEAAGEARDLTLLRLGYRGGLDEAGLGKAFDFSRATLADRWATGARAMQDGLRRLGGPDAGQALAPGLRLIEVAEGV